MTVIVVTPETNAWCAERDHPYVTYNPMLDRRYCRCGERQEAGELPMDWLAKWQMFHDHGYDDPCRCYRRPRGEQP